VKKESRLQPESSGKKGPTAKGLVLLKRGAKSSTAVDSQESQDDSDETYIPSSDTDSDDDDNDSSHSVSEGSVTANNDQMNEGEWTLPAKRNKQFQYTVHDGICDTVCGANGNPIDFFSLFIDDGILTIMVNETNRNAAQTIGINTVSSESRLQGWGVDTDKDEMKVFIGILIWMDLVRMPSIDSYWRHSLIYQNSVASRHMTRNRFQLLLRTWHFADNSEASQGDKLHKIKNLVEMMMARFQSAKTPGQDIVVDESIIPFRGRLSFRQYMPGKSSKYGVKVFKLCDATGYTYALSIYAGKGNDLSLGLASGIVMKSATPYLDAGRTICTDNYYTSMTLSRQLLNNQTHLVGTLRSNRKGLPKAVTSAHLRKGQIIARENSDGTVVFKWHDKRDVLMLSTRHSDDMASFCNRRNETVHKPAATIYYNGTKQGIDVSDQMASYHSALRKRHVRQCVGTTK
jgi:hypothetical protein